MLCYATVVLIVLGGEGGVSLVVAGHRDREEGTAVVLFAKAPSVALVGRNYTQRHSHIQTSDQVCTSKQV